MLCAGASRRGGFCCWDGRVCSKLAWCSALPAASTWHGRRCLRHLGVAATQHASQHTGVSMRASGVGCRVEPGAREQEQRLRRQRHPRSRRQHGRGRSSSCSLNSSRAAGRHGQLAAPPPVGSWLRHRSRPPHERCRPRHARARAHAPHPACSLVRRALRSPPGERHLPGGLHRGEAQVCAVHQPQRGPLPEAPLPQGAVPHRGAVRARSGAAGECWRPWPAARWRRANAGGCRVDGAPPWLQQWRDGSQTDGSQPAGGAARYDAPLPRAAHVSALLAARPAAA